MCVLSPIYKELIDGSLPNYPSKFIRLAFSYQRRIEYSPELYLRVLLRKEAQGMLSCRVIQTNTMFLDLQETIPRSKISRQNLQRLRIELLMLSPDKKCYSSRESGDIHSDF
jgi:hypothetical protein